MERIAVSRIRVAAGAKGERQVRRAHALHTRLIIMKEKVLHIIYKFR